MSIAPNQTAANTSLQSINGLPTKEEAKKVFWGLGDRFWMQIIDGKNHQHGPRVYDEGLHKGDKEPGFFASLKKGCLFASEHFGEKLTVSFYRELHKNLCAHFNGKNTCTEIGLDKIGCFRNCKCRCRMPIREFNAESKAHYAIVKTYDKENLYILQKQNPEKYQKLCSAYPYSKKWVEGWENAWEQKTQELECYVAETCKRLGVQKFVTIHKLDSVITVHYDCISPEEHERIVQKLFDCYNLEIQKINGVLSMLKNGLKEEEIQQAIEDKVSVIAGLFQLLEWLHPFFDGQGRTDLVLQAMLLAQEGANPPVLKNPYFSTWALFPDWKECLLKGIEVWKAEKTAKKV